MCLFHLLEVRHSFVFSLECAQFTHKQVHCVRMNHFETALSVAERVDEVTEDLVLFLLAQSFNPLVESVKLLQHQRHMVTEVLG